MKTKSERAADKPTAHRARRVISSVLFYLMLALILFATVFMLVRGRDSDEPLFVFDRSCLWVETGSMKPTIDERSYVLVHRAENETFEVGDVIVFPCPDPQSPVYGSLIIHRIVEVTDDGYLTKGDSRLSVVDSWTVKPETVVAVWERNMPVMTFAGRAFSSPLGLVALCGLFLALCAFVYLPEIVRGVREGVREDTDEQHRAEIERRIREEVERLEQENAHKDE